MGIEALQLLHVKPVVQQPGMLDPDSRRLSGRRWLW